MKPEALKTNTPVWVQITDKKILKAGYVVHAKGKSVQVRVPGLPGTLDLPRSRVRRA